MSVDGSPSVRSIDGWLDEHGDDLIAIRRRIHARPEPSFEEHQTTELIEERLRLAGLEPRPLASGTGLVCDLAADDDDRQRLAFRAELDALAMDDDKDTPYRSQVPGVAHGCGHDVHATIILGAALYFARHRDELPGPIRCIFQPAEERVPGGAIATIADGVLDGTAAIVGLHCDPKLDRGSVGIRAGAVSSAADMLSITINGPGGHTARPERTVDMIPLAARVVQELPLRVAERFDDPAAVRIGFGMLRSGDAANVIPAHSALRASVRTPSNEVWDALPGVVDEVLAGLLAGTGASHEVVYTKGVPPVVNDEDMTDLLRAAAVEELGEVAVVETAQSWGGDDFAWYLQHRPGTFARIGVHDPDSPEYLDLHSGRFDVDERAIAVAVRLVVATTQRFFSA